MVIGNGSRNVIGLTVYRASWTILGVNGHLNGYEMIMAFVEHMQWCLSCSVCHFRSINYELTLDVFQYLLRAYLAIYSFSMLIYVNGSNTV